MNSYCDSVGYFHDASIGFAINSEREYVGTMRHGRWNGLARGAKCDPVNRVLEFFSSLCCDRRSLLRMLQPDDREDVARNRCV